MYGIIAFFDNKTEEFLRQIWRELVDNSISFYSEESGDKRPHITIADYNKIDEEKFIDSMDEFYGSKEEVEITLSTLGTFLNSGTLFISPTLSKDLLDFHNGHHEYFKAYNDDPNSFYLPSKWIPHCTIANRLSHEKLIEAFDFCSRKIGMIKATISEIALIKVIYEGNKCIAAPTIFSKKLK